jgi:hypothetical protein
MEIKITCETKDYAKIENLIPIQGNLKDFSQSAYLKMRKEIIDLGFSFPFFVWEDGGTLKILDGTHRKRVINEMIKEGFTFPEKLPIVKIHAKDYSEAKKKLLAATSSYAKITEEGLREFIYDIKDISMEEIRDSFDLEGINFETFKIELNDEPLLDGDELEGEDKDSSGGEDRPREYLLQVELPTELELRDLYDDLVSKGYLVREV